MGQRLVITVKKNNENIAAIYYHWSAYTTSALDEAKKLINMLYDENNKEPDIRLNLIRCIEKIGGNVDMSDHNLEFDKIQKLYPNEIFKTNGSRNDGLIAITEEGMDAMDYWAEGTLIIDLDDEIIYNDVYNFYSIDEYNDENETDKKIEDFSDEMDIEEIPFDKIDEAINYIEEKGENGIRSSCNDEMILFPIE